MNITNQIDRYFDEIAEMAYEKYCEEVKRHSCLTKRTKAGFTEFFREKLQGMKGIIGLEDGNCVGFLLYSLWEEEKLYCGIPVWGYGTNSPKDVQVIGYLFQYLAEQVVLENPVCFSVRLYAHDEKIQKLFSLMQFGIQSEKGVRRIEKIEYTTKYKVREIGKEELCLKWEEIWNLLAQLIAHLQKSPVFYPGYEFTEEVYREFFMESGTRVYLAEDKDKIIGLIEANPENMEYLFWNVQAVNVGEAYVEPEYRGQKAAQALLHSLDAALRADGIDYEWVEHGTANPTARGFWNKYFETVEYEFIRSIEC